MSSAIHATCGRALLPGDRAHEAELTDPGEDVRGALQGDAARSVTEAPGPTGDGQGPREAEVALRVRGGGGPRIEPVHPVAVRRGEARRSLLGVRVHPAVDESVARRRALAEVQGMPRAADEE